MKASLLASCSVSAWLIALPALAQNGLATPDLNASPVPGGTAQNQSQGAAAPNQPQPGAGRLETIVVTAQKRREVAQRVAASVASISPATLSRAGVRDFDTISKVLPDIRVDDIGGAANITIRGINEGSVGPTGDGPAAVHLDGVYLARQTGLSGLFYDVQRIEELPGPQGTLYGRNATSGVINVITNKPTDTFGGYVEAEGGNYGLYRLNGALNVPVNDDLDLRGAFHSYHHDGYFDNGFNNANESGGRLSARVKISPDATLLLSADYQATRQRGDGAAIYASTYGSPQMAAPPGPPPPGAPPPPPPLPGSIEISPGTLQVQPGTYPVSSNPFSNTNILYPLGAGPSSQNLTTYGVMAELDYDLGAAALTAQFGARRVFVDGNQIGFGDTFTPPPTISNTYTPAASSTYSAELRLASKATTPFQWVGGLYYFTEKLSGDFCGTQSFAPGMCGLETNNPFQRDISYAAFGQGTYTPPILHDRLHLTLGARYNQDKKNGATYETFLGTPLANSPDLKVTFDATTYLARASYDITAKNLVYALNSTGYRAGGIAYGNLPIYQPETNQAWEIGSKNRFFDDRLQINLAGYRYIYKNSETNVIQFAPPGSPVPFANITSINIGKNHYTGASLDVEFAATPDDRVELNVQYLDATYVRFVIPAIYATSVPLDLKGIPTNQPLGVQNGLQVTEAPPWVGTFAYDHSFHALAGTIDGRAAVQFSDYVSYDATYTNTLQYKYSRVPAYARLDLSVNYVPDRGNWQATAYVNNVTGENTFVNNIYEGGGVNGSGIVVANLLPPRTYGLIVNTKF